MKNKFDIFNDMKIDENEFEEITLSNEEKDKMKKRMKSKIKNKKKVNYKKYIAVAGVPLLIAGSIAMTSETTWAYIEEIGKQIEILLGRKEEEFNVYKVSVNQTIEQDGIKLNLKELMLDDGQIILSMNMDYSNFDYEKLNADEESLMLNICNVSVNDLMYAGIGYSISQEPLKGEKQKNLLIKGDLVDIDTDGDFVGDTPYELLDNIETDKDYKIKIEFNELCYETNEINEENKNNIVGSGEYESVDQSDTGEFNIGSYPLDLQFETTINGANIIKDTKVCKINKKINIKDGNKKGILTIEEARVSPVSVKVKYTFESDDINEMYEPVLMAKDENGKELLSSSGGTGKGNVVYLKSEIDLKGNEKKITIIPKAYNGTMYKPMKEESIEINIK
ncbi:MAG: DUF4179 domain-containing protein [Romboutsia sp.]|uniref:DUF4179 domain-containing protein n=1 Tax=Romboutsia sp. TaxID=1965302 RepID=UPI003F37E21B